MNESRRSRRQTGAVERERNEISKLCNRHASCLGIVSLGTGCKLNEAYGLSDADNFAIKKVPAVLVEGC